MATRVLIIPILIVLLVAQPIGTQAGPFMLDAAAVRTAQDRLPNRAHELRPGLPITVVHRDGTTTHPYLLAVNSAEIDARPDGEFWLAVMDLDTIDLPSVIKRSLLDVVHWRPTELAGVLNGKTVEAKNRRMRIAAEGLFVNGDRVADTSQMIKSLARDDIVSIRGRIDPHRLRRHVLLWTMGTAAAVLGTIAAFWINHRLPSGEEGNTFLVFIPIGAVVGVYYLGGKPQDDVLVYEAP